MFQLSHSCLAIREIENNFKGNELKVSTAISFKFQGEIDQNIFLNSRLFPQSLSATLSKKDCSKKKSKSAVNKIFISIY